MRKPIILAALLSAAAIPAPASAHHGHGYRGGGLEAQIWRLDSNVNRAYNRGLISPREARRLNRRLNRISRRLDRYRYGGLRRWERREIRSRIQNVRHDFRRDVRDGPHYY